MYDSPNVGYIMYYDRFNVADPRLERHSHNDVLTIQYIRAPLHTHTRVSIRQLKDAPTSQVVVVVVHTETRAVAIAAVWTIASASQPPTPSKHISYINNVW